MSPPSQGFRVGITGASSLLGKEVTAVLKERAFPVSRLVTGENEEDEPEMPVLDLEEGIVTILPNEKFTESDFDFVFVANIPKQASAMSSDASEEAPFLRSASQLARTNKVRVIDMSGGLAAESGGIIRIPFLERAFARKSAPAKASGSYSVSAHPAAIVVSTLLLRLAARFTLKSAVVQVFGPVSEFGPLALDELQKQTVAVLSFQKIPQKVFGRQLTFNLLARFERARQKGAPLAAVESRIHDQLKSFLGDRAPRFALRLIQAPVFHALAFSLYVETDGAVPAGMLAKALEGERVQVRKTSEPSPSQVETAGSDDIFVDAPVPDSTNPEGVWIWAVADNLRLAAVNAVEIAESETARVRS
jgi:aspartate-semialdehyde dehydrogenase